MTVKFLDLQKLNASFQPELNEAIARVTESGWYIQGPELESFENAFARYCKAKHCIGTGNGLDALLLIFEGLKVMGKLTDGDKILVPANTFIASILAIKRAGLTPVLCEPDAATYNLSVETAKSVMTPDIKGILMVHLYGRISEAAELAHYCNQNGLLLIEDAAQAHGAEISDGKRAGTIGLAAGFSFYPGKNLGALGDGGAITTNNDELAEIFRKLSNYGSSEKYVHDLEGVNSRLDPIQAAALLLKLRRLDEDNERRRSIAERYSKQIHNAAINLPELPDNRNSHVWHLFTIQVADRSQFQKFMQTNGIQTLIHYPIPPHQQKGLSELSSLSFPLTERIHQHIVSLPISPIMTDDEVEHVIRRCNEYKV